jgi:2'-5' RNA ligase
MRLFVAIDVGPDVVARARSLIPALTARARHLAPRARITWVAPDRLHLTLHFIGEVDDVRADVIERALVMPFDQSLFTFEIGNLGVFPPKGAPRVIWVGVRHELDALRALHRQVSERLEAAGVVGDRQPYHPHLTLGRVREPAGLRSAALVDGFDDASVLGLVEVRAITLYASRLLPQGPQHLPVLRTPLGA